jgi:hypothetical protein
MRLRPLAGLAEPVSLVGTVAPSRLAELIRRGRLVAPALAPYY